ncbi:MAG: DMT family transporter, partial [Enterobacteriaceae bacterium]
LQYTTATAGGLISSAAPAFIVLLAFFLLREKISGPRIAGVLCVTAGIVAVNLPTTTETEQALSSLKGNGLVLLAVICEAAFAITSKSRACSLSALLKTAVIALYATLFLLPFALYDAYQYDFSALSGQSWLCIAWYGFFVSFLSYVFWFKGIVTVPAGVAASFTGFVPISSLFFSWLILHEQITVTGWIGLFCVLLGIGLACMGKQEQ